ncbi:sporulation integral membrane protein YlbJ [Clostridium sp. DSM 8431]|uniref:sporulation integral membrane protein YlbJ n=1 Tax=Clostridium sp. DSM 8431 TaxID=1761781 RepID=UPI0008EA0185|nr:sporulation integral membrane protein YlbJ [Clostridium sp. DSM 8431]SFU36902.1 sporulation integral membrane protein YlbJ [Clostridium sp. DSM 8431]
MFYIICLWLFIIILTILLIKQLKINSNYIICFFLTLLIIFFVLDINNSITASIEGCKLWFYSILPTIFPFLVICNLLISYNGIDLYSKILGPILCKPLGLSKASAFPITASILCGYPLGAKYCSDIYKENFISREEYLRLLNIATNCGPLFIIGPVAISMLGNIKFAYILLISNYIAPLIIGFLIRKNAKPLYLEKAISFHSSNVDFGTKFKTSINDAVKTSITIGAFIVIFSVIISIIKNNTYISIVFYKLELLLNLEKNSLYSLFLGSIEITNGCSLISKSYLALPLKLSIISFLCSFSGICIIAQVSSFISEHKVSLLNYSLLKFIQGILSFIITFILSKLTLTSLETSSIVSSTTSNFSIYYYIVPTILILFMYLILKIFNKLLFHIS